MKVLKKFLTSYFRLIMAITLVISFFLRVVALSSVPPSPYWEEAAIGYDAYSILKTGRDHHGNIFPIVAFESFGDFKPSLYFYSVVPFVGLFGLNIWAVRLPSVLAGTIIVLLSGLLAREISTSFSPKASVDHHRAIQLLTTIIATVSPWAIIFSRGGWEANLASCLILAGVYCGYKSWQAAKGKNWRLVLTVNSARWLLASSMLLSLSLYCYHAARITSPILGLIIFIPFIIKIRKQFTFLVPIVFLAVLISSPLLSSFGSQTISQRFHETSIFSDISIIEKSNQLIANDGNTWWAKTIHHRYLLFGNKILQNGLSHFSLDFLFLSGDINPRHSTQYFGQLLHLTIFPLLIGAVLFFKYAKTKENFLLSSWLIAGILPASLTTVVPHALRILSVAPIFYILIGIGWGSIPFVRRKFIFRLAALSFSALLFTEVAIFFYYYFGVYPKLYASEWQYGYQEMISTIQQNKRLNEQVTISREYGRPAMYYWFYTQTDPRQVQAQNDSVAKDQGEFLTFNNIRFSDSISGETTGLIASSARKFAEVGGEELTVIKDFRDTPIWIVYRKE